MKFNNPISALEYYRMKYDKINFVVLDLIMPNMSGKELFDELKK